jgi:two-component system KDP operon response regulator KdpE
VLVVDGSEDVRRLLRGLLRSEGFDVVDAGSLAGACSLMGKASFNLVVLDIILPDARGPELVESVRRMQPKAAVLVVSACAGCLEQRRLAGMGVGRVLAKPFKTAALLSSVRTLSAGPTATL